MSQPWVDQIIEPLTDRHIIVLRSRDWFDAETFHEWEDVLSRKFSDVKPLLVWLDNDASLDVLDEEDMRTAGWVRSPNAAWPSGGRT